MEGRVTRMIYHETTTTKRFGIQQQTALEPEGLHAPTESEPTLQQWSSESWNKAIGKNQGARHLRTLRRGQSQ